MIFRNQRFLTVTFKSGGFVLQRRNAMIKATNYYITVKKTI